MLESSFSDRLVLVLLAFVLNALLGGPLSLYRNVPSPVRGFDLVVRYVESKMNRNWRSANDLRMRGALLTLLVLGCGWVFGLWAERIGQTAYGPVPVALILACLLPLRPLYDAALYVTRALEANDLERARRELRQMARRNIGQADAHAVARTGIESLLRHFSDALLTPLCFYLWLGLPGLLLAVLANRLERLFSQRAPQQNAFAALALRTAQALRYIPARLAALVIALSASFVPRGNMPRAIVTAFRDAPKFKSANRGWPVAAGAGALGLTLGGPYSVHLNYVDDPWVVPRMRGGIASVKATAVDLRRALYLYAVSVGLMGFLLVLAGYGING